MVNSPAGVSSPYDEPAVVMVDGTLHRLRHDLKPETFRALLTARGGEQLAAAGKGSWNLLKDGRLRSRREP